MPLYKLTRGSIGIVVGEETVEVKKGQTVELPSDEKARSYSKYFRRTDLPDTANKAVETVPISTVTAESTSPDVTKTVNQPTRVDWSTSQEMKVADVIAQVNETNSVADLEALYDLEEKGQNRVTLLTHIEKRVAVLEGQQK